MFNIGDEVRYTGGDDIVFVEAGAVGVVTGIGHTLDEGDYVTVKFPAGTTHTVMGDTTVDFQQVILVSNVEVV